MVELSDACYASCLVIKQACLMSQDMHRLHSPLHVECQKWLACFVAGAAQTQTSPYLPEHLQHDGTERQHLLSPSPAEMLQASAQGQAAPLIYDNHAAVYAGTAINGTRGKAPDSCFGQPSVCCAH